MREALSFLGRINQQYCTRPSSVACECVVYQLLGEGQG